MTSSEIIGSLLRSESFLLYKKEVSRLVLEERERECRSGERMLERRWIWLQGVCDALGIEPTPTHLPNKIIENLRSMEGGTDESQGS